jgi:monoamine oxidase
VNETKYDVIVIGAGVSGLAAAQRLQTAKFRTLTLEARDRIGGRIQTDRGSGTALDMGASWIHGTRGNPVARLLKDNGASLYKTDFHSNTLYHNGQKVNESKAGTFFCKALDDFYRSIMRRKAAVAHDESVEVAFAHYLRRNNISGEQERVLRHILCAEIESTYGANMSNLSLKWFHEDEEYSGGNVFVASGYDALANELSRDLDIRLRSPVSGIRDEGASVAVSAGSREYQSDYVVVTVPLGVLQKGVIDFSPELSNVKQKALKGLGMGNLHKTFVEFSDDFWDNTQTIDVVHDGVKWREFINLSKETGRPILLALNGGEAASELLHMSRDNIAGEIFSVLRDAYPNATRPLGVTTTEWERDPFSYGSYSIVPVGGSLEMYDDLAKPQGRIFFAGEHTNGSYPATVHGAYLSGIRAAKSLKRRRALKKI